MLRVGVSSEGRAPGLNQSTGGGGGPSASTATRGCHSLAPAEAAQRGASPLRPAGPRGSSWPVGFLSSLGTGCGSGCLGASQVSRVPTADVEACGSLQPRALAEVLLASLLLFGAVMLPGSGGRTVWSPGIQCGGEFGHCLHIFGTASLLPRAATRAPPS